VLQNGFWWLFDSFAMFKHSRIAGTAVAATHFAAQLKLVTARN